jgi:hypothetical protein
MKQKLLFLAVTAIVGSALIAVPFDADAAKRTNKGSTAAAKSPHKFKADVGLQLRSNTNINVAPSSSDSFNLADFSDFDEAEAKLDGDDEDEDEGEEGDDDFGDDDFDDVGIDDADLSEEDFDLATDDDDGDGDEDDEDDDGMDDDDDDDDGDDGDGGSSSKAMYANDDQLDDLIDSALEAKMATRSTKLNRWSAKIGFGHKYTFDGDFVVWGSSFKGVGDFHNGKDNLDKSNYAFSTGPEFIWKDLGFKLKPVVSYLSVFQKGDGIVGTFIGSLAGSYDINKQFSVDAVYNYQDRDIEKPESPDAIVNSFTVGGEWTASKFDIFKAKYSPKVEDSSKVTKSKDTTGWQLSYSRKLPAEFILGFGVKQDSVEFVNLPLVRKDDILAYTVNVAKQWSKNFEMSLAWESRKLDSNIQKNDATNRSVVLGMTYKF